MAKELVVTKASLTRLGRAMTEEYGYNIFAHLKDGYELTGTDKHALRNPRLSDALSPTEFEKTFFPIMSGKNAFNEETLHEATIYDEPSIIRVI